MISASNSVKDLFKKNYAINVNVGGTIEYNLNNMIDKITATSNGTDHALSNAFKNLFPIDTIYSPNRPLSPGIKYYIYTTETSPGVQTDTPPNSFDNPRSPLMPTKPRLYYPGPDTTYKYWLGPKNSNIDVSLEYFDNAATPAAKLIPSNKVIARFEINHDTPTAWQIFGTKSDGSEISLGSGTTLNSKGEAIVYYNGTAWSTTEPSSYTTTQSFKKIRLTATNSNTGKFLAVLELSPRWVVDISSHIQNFSISKQTSIDDDSILPVGTIASSLLSINITKFIQDDATLIEYNRDSNIDSSKIYLDKNVIVSPYYLIKDNGVDVKIEQGKFYMTEWSISEFGSAAINALDSTKILQDTIAPLILVQDTPVTAIIKRLLDSIGYSNYNINIEEAKSVPSLKYFWTKDGETVWESLQALCRDFQINIFVDSNDKLQVYTKDSIYKSSRSYDWIFTNEEISSGGVVSYIPNIINLNKKEKIAGNSVKILWSAPFTTGYASNSSGPIWASAEDGLAAGELSVNLNDNETNYISLKLQTIDQLIDQDLVIQDFTGFLLIDSEIIEYDGIEYTYIKESDGKKEEGVLIQSAADFWKHASLAKTDEQNINTFKPTGRYKIKKRGALGTTAKSHTIPSATVIKDSVIDLVAPGDPEFKGDINNLYYSAQDAWNKKSPFISKAFLPVTNFDRSKTKFTTKVIPFDSISTTSKPGFYSMGTRVFFDNQFDTGLKDSYATDQIGGFTFFAGEIGKKGYHLIISTTAGAKSGKDVRLLKTTSQGVTTILDTKQSTALTTFAGVYAAQTYNIDILVKSVYNTSGSLIKNVITIFINGFKIYLEDISSPLAPSNRVGLLCGQGVVYYDYVYGLNIPEKSTTTEIDYEQLQSKGAYVYNGVYSDDTVSLLFGDMIYSAGETVDSRNGSLKEFGSVVRQIKKIKARYDESNPAIPIYISTGVNRSVNLMAKKLQPFSLEAVVMNNTSGFVNLADGEYNSFQVVGNPVIQGGVVEYSTDDPNSKAKKYPIQFESTWIQSQTDAKELADWIIATQLNKGKSVSLSVFGNPLIEAGDIIAINYPIQDMTYQQGKYIVTSVITEFYEGVGTSIECRAI